MANRFCSSCGAKVVTGASFCVECGEPQAGARAPRRSVGHLSERFAPMLVIGGVLLIGSAAVLYGRYNQVPPTSVARPDAAAQGAGAQGAGAPGSGAPGGGAAGQSAGNLPGDHPPIKIPEEIKSNIAEMQRKADAAPDDLATWKQLADVQYRAGQLEPEYLAKAETAYRHIVEKDAKNLEGLRGLGNVAYDQQQPGVAMTYYQKYLEIKPDDLEVRTDLGTMYLSGGNPQKALDTYQNVLQTDPSFFQAQFNVAIAYRGLGDNDKALVAMEKARGMAPDDRTRTQVNTFIARMKGEPPPPAAVAAAPGAPGAPASSGAPKAPVAAAPAAGADTFRGAAEAIFRQNPIMGPKVQRVEWSGDTSAKVFLRDFPMDQMGPDMMAMFSDRMKGRIREQKAKFGVTAPASFDLVDEASSKVMTTVTE